MKVKIICGAYGFRPANRPETVQTVRAGGICDVPAEEAKRLVAMKVAEYVDEKPGTTPPGGSDDNGAGTSTNDGNGPAVVALDGIEVPDALAIVDGHFDKKGLNEMTNNNLKKLAQDLGLDVSKCRVKADFIAVLTAVTIEISDTDNEGDGDGEDGDNEDDGSGTAGGPPITTDDTIVQ